MEQNEQPRKPSRLVGAWWGPAVGLSGIGLVAAAEAERTDVATREVFFNVQQPWAVYVFLSMLVGLLVYGLGVGVTNQNRIAVADMFPFSRRGEGLGYVLTASVVGAISAPLFLLVGTGIATLFGLQNLSLQFMAVIWFTGSLLMIPPLVLNKMVRPDPR